MSAGKKGKRGSVKVRFLRDGRVIRTYKVKSDVVTIGTAPGCNIRAGEQAALAPHHATIYVRYGEISLVPEPGATVELNGEPVDFAIAQPTDVIKVGRLTFAVELADSTATSSVSNPHAPPAGETSKRRKPPWFVFSKKDDHAESPSDEQAQRELAAFFEMDEQPTRIVSWEDEFPNLTASLRDDERDSAVDEPFTQDVETVRHSSDLYEMARRMDSGADEAAGASGEVLRDSEPPTKVARPGEYPVVEQRTKVARNPLISGAAPDPDVISNPAAAPDLGAAPDPDAISNPASSIEEEPSSAAPVEADLPRDEYYFSDDEYDEEHFVEPFDLSEALSPVPVTREGPRESYVGVSVVRVLSGRVVDVFGALPQKPFVALRRELKCRVSRRKVKLRVHRSLSGELRVQGRTVFLDSGTRRKYRRMVLKDGDGGVLKGAEGVYKLSVFRPPVIPKARVQDKKALFSALASLLGFAFALHLSAALALFFFFQPVLIEVDYKEPQEIFAEVTLEALETLKPLPKTGLGSEDVDRSDTLSLSEKVPAIFGETLRVVKDRKKDVAGVSRQEALGEEPPKTGAEKDATFEEARGRVTWGASTVIVQGSLTREDVVGVVDRDLQGIQDCYERALVKKPDLAGRIVFGWTVKSSGRVAGVWARLSTLGRAGVVSCISKRIRAWQFPRPANGGAMITSAFRFEPLSPE